MNKKIRHLISAIVSIVVIILIFIAINHVENYKNVKKAEYMRKVNNTIIDALSEISKYEMREHIKDSLKYQYWSTFRSIKNRNLQFYPINDNGKWKIARQIIGSRYLEFGTLIKKEDAFVYDDYVPTFVAGADMLEEIVADVHLYAFFDTIRSHSAVQPVYKDYESDTIRSIIEKHLRKNNIYSDFEYCIYVPVFDKFVLCDQANIIEIIAKGKLYNFEVYNQNMRLNAFFLIQFLNNTNYLTAYDGFVIIFTWGIVFIVWLLFIYLLFTDKRINEVSVLRDDFVNNITHEFKTPISTIALATESLLDKDVLENKDMREKCVEVIQEENERLERMVETILQTASTSQKSFLLRQKKNDVDSHYCIEPAIKEILLLLHKKKGTITVEYSAKNSITHIDGTQIILVIKNILDNAIKYTLDVPPHIEIKTVNKGKYILISIKDNGIGMTKKQQKKIFNKLYRSNTGDIHNVKGYGLGLYNAKAIIKSHKGKIKVESELNKGSTFTIYLPVVK